MSMWKMMKPLLQKGYQGTIKDEETRIFLNSTYERSKADADCNDADGDVNGHGTESTGEL